MGHHPKMWLGKDYIWHFMGTFSQIFWSDFSETGWVSLIMTICKPLWLLTLILNTLCNLATELFKSGIILKGDMSVVAYQHRRVACTVCMAELGQMKPCSLCFLYNCNPSKPGEGSQVYGEDCWVLQEEQLIKVFPVHRLHAGEKETFMCWCLDSPGWPSRMTQLRGNGAFSLSPLWLVFVFRIAGLIMPSTAGANGKCYSIFRCWKICKKGLCSPSVIVDSKAELLDIKMSGKFQMWRCYTDQRFVTCIPAFHTCLLCYHCIVIALRCGKVMENFSLPRRCCFVKNVTIEVGFYLKMLFIHRWCKTSLLMLGPVFVLSLCPWFPECFVALKQRKMVKQHNSPLKKSFQFLSSVENSDKRMETDGVHCLQMRNIIMCEHQNELL